MIRSANGKLHKVCDSNFVTNKSTICCLHVAGPNWSEDLDSDEGNTIFIIAHK